MKTKLALGLILVIMLGLAGNMVMVWKNGHLAESDTQEMTATVAEVICETDGSTWSIRVTAPDGTLAVPSAVSESLFCGRAGAVPAENAAERACLDGFRHRAAHQTESGNQYGIKHEWVPPVGFLFR